MKIILTGATGVLGSHIMYEILELFIKKTNVDNKLYLNYNLKVKELWTKDREARIIKANEYWKTLKK